MQQPVETIVRHVNWVLNLLNSYSQWEQRQSWLNYMRDQGNLLQDKRILVTRPKHQSQRLTQLIERAGGHAIQFPVLEITHPEDIQTVTKQLSNTRKPDWLIFTSANAVDFAIICCQHQLPISQNTKIAAIGDNTAKTLRSYGISVDLIPRISSSEGLAAALNLQQMNNKQCLIIKGEGGRSVLSRLLIQQGASVTTADVYRRICPSIDASSLLDQWRYQAIDYVSVNSIEALDNLIQLIGDEGWDLLKKSVLIALSQRVGDAAYKRGLSNVVTATSTSDSGIIESIVQIQQNGLKSTPRVQTN